jgi:hypothetical protein
VGCGGKDGVMADDDGGTEELEPPSAVTSLPSLTAEWALWGRRPRETGYSVLACSNGRLSAADFAAVISRYACGAPDALPQYTLCWIPPDEQSRPAYLAVAIRELADPDPDRAGGRPRYVAGREVHYIRLFCFRYADVAELGADYTDLADAVRAEQLPLGSAVTAPLVVHPPATPPAPVSPLVRPLAEQAAALLLTTRPVCVLGAEEVTADERLAFIGHVMSLLPFGLRATLSAATWASSTAVDLRLRLFFSTARRDSGSQTSYVTWGEPDKPAPPGTPPGAAGPYREWLKDAGDELIARLSQLTTPVRFTDDDLSRMLASLPRDKTLADTVAELSASLRASDQPAVSAALKELRLYLPRQGEQPADRAACRSLVEEYELFADCPGLHIATKKRLYGTLIQLAFGTELSYADYCAVERAAAGKLDWPLRKVLLDSGALALLPWILAAKAAPGTRDEELIAALGPQGVSATYLLDMLAKETERVRPEHRAAAYDFAVRYLRAQAEDPQQELTRRGHLADALAALFPHDQLAQQARLEDTLRFVYGGPLTRAQIVSLYDTPGLRPTPALAAAVVSLATRHRQGEA